MARAGWFLWEKFLVVMVGTGAERVGANIVRPQNHAAATLLPGNTGTSAPHPALQGHLPPRRKAGKFYPSKFVMLFKLTPRVEALCSRAEVAGGRMPMAPSTIRVLLKLMIKR
jgi:hypothetical protein